MTELTPVLRGAFVALLALLPGRERAHLRARVLEGVEQGWRTRRRDRGRTAALRFVAREWVDLARNVVVARLSGRDGRRSERWSGRRGTMMEGIGFDVRAAVRGLRRSPALVVGAVLTLGIGIGANLALFSVLHGVLLRPLPYGEADRLVVLYSAWEDRELGLSWVEIDDVHRESQTLSEAAGIVLPGMDARAVLSLDGGPRPVEALRVSPNFFDVLDVEPRLGPGIRADGPLARVEASVLLSDAAWRGRWGADPEVVGTDLMVAGVSHRVAGVLPADFVFQLGARPPELFLVRTPAEIEMADRSQPIVLPVARVRSGIELDAARAEIGALGPALAAARPPDAPDVELRLRTVHEQLVGDVRRPLGILSLAAVLVFVVACANLASLFLARHTEREADQALRAALGAGRERLARIPLIEAVLLGLGGGAAGLLLAHLATSVTLARIPDPLFRYDGLTIGPLAGLLTVGLSLLAGLLFGGRPAWSSARIRPGVALARSGFRGAAVSTRAIRWLAGAEAAALMVLLAATGLSLRSLDALLDVDLGFEREGRSAATVLVPPDHYGREEYGDVVIRMEERVAALPDVRAAGMVTHLPLDPNNWGGTLTVEGEEAEGGAAVEWELASPGYFGAAGIDLLRGRSFSRDDRPDAPFVTVVSRTLARMARPGGDLTDALGVRVSGTGPEGPWMEIVGVVEDVRQRRVGGEPRPHMYLPPAQVYSSAEWELVLSSGAEDPLAVLVEAEAALREIEPEIVVAGPRTLESLVERALGRPRVVSSLLVIFGLASLILALTGIYGVTAFAVARRRREIGIRACLGASRGLLFGRALAEAVLPVAGGVAVGLVVVVAAAPRAREMLYRVDPLDPLTLGVASTLLVGAAAATAWWPAVRGATVDPAEVLGDG